MPSTEIAIETERLLLRDYGVEDAEAALALYADDEVMRFLGGVQHRDAESLRGWLATLGPKYDAYRAAGLPHGAWAVIEKEGGALVGTALLKPLPDVQKVDTDDIEIGWHLARSAWGKGYATEFARALVERAFTRLAIGVLHVVVEPGNARSEAVARRLGTTQHARVDRYYGKTMEHYTIERADWEARA
jgi:ribosomal-protein-alanine N-acetyltransferase